MMPVSRCIRQGFFELFLVDELSKFIHRLHGKEGRVFFAPSWCWVADRRDNRQESASMNCWEYIERQSTIDYLLYAHEIRRGEGEIEKCVQPPQAADPSLCFLEPVHLGQLAR